MLEKIQMEIGWYIGDRKPFVVVAVGLFERPPTV